MTRCLLVPGRGIPLAGHWSRLWVESHPDYRWAPEPPGPPYIATERVAALHEALGADDEPAILIAHSAGCLTVASWASRHVGPVRAALLVTPPYLDPDWTPGPGEPDDDVVDEIPRRPLPFPSILVASRTDTYATFAQFQQYARDWGAELFDAGNVGHLDSASGYGPWPEGERLVESLAAR
ncbi:RBBP9/YdeN family alpha/beta hydrolase [Plantactinospora soyae]|uniref:Alpha/beta hydrolase family esterase n=1 Tax=Plantactinospora soyae TaxID=1544732 RepID=A0A927M9V8_9ACTN|nr:alpha/beta fold hydrolase [Plantactinospora soyae]MBE1490672.1 putative alpha/beta hydrolase family esterase [Plantactinospora soyae]